VSNILCSLLLYHIRIADTKAELQHSDQLSPAGRIQRWSGRGSTTRSGACKGFRYPATSTCTGQKSCTGNAVTCGTATSSAKSRGNACVRYCSRAPTLLLSRESRREYVLAQAHLFNDKKNVITHKPKKLN
jgi:hypothetical protein